MSNLLEVLLTTFSLSYTHKDNVYACAQYREKKRNNFFLKKRTSETIKSSLYNSILKEQIIALLFLCLI